MICFPAAGDLDVRFIDEPAIAARVPRRMRGVDELGGEALHPPVDLTWSISVSAFGNRLLDVAVGQVVAQYQRAATAITCRGKG